jgi:hypothetical protein
MPLAHEAMHRALSGGFRKTAAVTAGVSDSTVDAWCVPPKSLDGNGIPCPAQRFIDIQLGLKRAGHDDPFYLLRHACRELGHLPPVHTDDADKDVSLTVIATAMKEFAELLRTVAEVSADGILSATDADRVYIEAEQVYLALAPLFPWMHSVVVDEEEAIVRERRGPKRILPQTIQLRRLA